MLPDRISSAFQTAAQGLEMQRERINVASRNIANINASSVEGSASTYRPQTVKATAPEDSKFRAALRKSISSEQGSLREAYQSKNMGPSFEIEETDSFRLEYDPNHPDANEKGMVRYPDVDMVAEMSKMVSANRLYEANLSSIAAEKKIMKQSLKI